MEIDGDEGWQSPPLNSPIPHASLPSCPLPPSSLPSPGTSPSRPPNLHTVIARMSPTKPPASPHSKTKDGLIRMLLQASPAQQAPPAAGYLATLCGSERALSLIQLDHCYSKPWNWKPESSLCQPTKTLFVPRVARNCTLVDTEQPEEAEPDVTATSLAAGPPYDPQQAYKVMHECDKFVSFANPRLASGGEEDELAGWEESIPREGWSPAQAKLFSKVMKVLTQDRLARLALEGQDSEPVLRRIAVDRAAKRVRAVLAAPPCVWDTRLVQWLQALLTARLPRPYLAAWLDVLQTLRARLPALVERLVAAPAGGFHLDSAARRVSREGLHLLLRRPWDPAATGLTRRRLARLPGAPVLVVAPPGPQDPRAASRRMRLWNNQLGCLGKVIVINVNLGPRGEAREGRAPANHYLYQMVTATLNKVREIKHSAEARPVVLLGWGVGAAIAAHVAGVERLAGLVCLGFPVSTLAGCRGQAGDPLLELKTPVLFVVGERCSQAGTDDLEDLRERLGVETGLVIVGGADSKLRLSRRKKKAEHVTQCMVDRCIMDEVREFLGGLLSSRQGGFPQEATFAVPTQEAAARKVRNRKRNSSDSGPSPVSPGRKARPPAHQAAANTNPKKPKKAKKSKSTDSSSSGVPDTAHRTLVHHPTTPTLSPSTLHTLPSPSLARLALPASLLSISSPLPQLSPEPSLSPPLLPVRAPPTSPLLSTALTSPRPHRPHSPTPRVIQYATGRARLPGHPTSPRAPDPLSPPPSLTAPSWLGPRGAPGLLAIPRGLPRPPGPPRPLAALQAHAAAQELRMRGLVGQGRGGTGEGTFPPTPQ